MCHNSYSSTPPLFRDERREGTEQGMATKSMRGMRERASNP